MLELLHKSNSRMVAVELLNAAAWNATGSVAIAGEWVLAVGFEEKRTTVEWQRSTLLAELKRDPVVVDGIWWRVTDLQIHPASRYIGKATVRPSQTAEFAIRANREGVLVHSQPLNGIVWAHGETAPGGFDLRRGATAIANSSPARELMKRVKQALDPGDVFNPGRLV